MTQKNGNYKKNINQKIEIQPHTLTHTQISVEQGESKNLHIIYQKVIKTF